MRMRPIAPGFVGLCLFSLAWLAPAAADEKADAEAYYKVVDKARRDVSGAGFDFGRSLGPLLNREEAIDPAVVLEKFYAMKKACDEAAAAVAKAKPPAEEKAQACVKAAAAFLKTQKRLIDLELAAATQVALDDEVPNKEKKERILKLFGKVVAGEKKDSAALREALQALAEAHGIEEQ